MAAGSTYTPISTTTLGSNQASVTLSSFSGYTDLRVVLNIKTTAGGFAIQPNSNSGSIYSTTNLRGNGSAASATRLSSADLGGTGFYLQNGSISTANFNTVILDFLNYANTSTYKTMLARFNNTVNIVGTTVGAMQSTSAITSLVLSCDGGGNIASGTTITVYGILAA
jgi:hypothetical protein